MKVVHRAILILSTILLVACGGGDAPVSDIHAVIMFGDSNCTGFNSNSPPAEADPCLASVRMFRDVFNSTTADISDTRLTRLKVTVATVTYHSIELQLGVDLWKAGYDAVIIKIGAVSTEMLEDWGIGGLSNARLRSSLTTAIQFIQAGFPTARIVPHIIPISGEPEACNTGGNGQAVADSWAADFQDLKEQLDGDLTTLLGRTINMRPHVPRINHDLILRGDAVYLDNVRAQNILAASNMNGFWYDTDDCSVNSDHTHLDGPGNNLKGKRIAAGIILENIQDQLGAPTLPDAIVHSLLDHAFGGGDYTPLANVYAALFNGNPSSGGTELSGGGYARLTIANNTTNFAAAALNRKTFAISQKHFQATSALGNVDYLAFYDASTSGTRLFYSQIPAVRNMRYGAIQVLRLGMPLVVLGGDIAQYLAHKLLDLLLGATSYARPATVYLGALVSGVEVSGNGYARVPIINNATNFPAASSRTKKLATQAQFPEATGNWGSVTSLALYDSAAAGNQMATFTCAATPISAGKRLVAAANAVSLAVS